MEKKIILWLEDRPDTAYSEIAWVKNQGFDVTIISVINRLADLLKEKFENIALIIIDIMLYGINNLESIGIKDAPTDKGYRAGLVLLEQYLRSGEGKEDKDLSSIPVLLLSSRKLTQEERDVVEELTERHGHAPVKYIEKGGLDIDGKRVWQDIFKKTFAELTEGA